MLEWSGRKNNFKKINKVEIDENLYLTVILKFFVTAL